MDISCVTCKTTMHGSKRGGHRYWKCPSCRAHGASLGYVLRYAGKEYVEKFRSIQGAKTASRQRACPCCMKSMTIALQVDDNLELDICRPCRFVWFDSGEIEVVAASVTSRRRAVGADEPPEEIDSGYDDPDSWDQNYVPQDDLDAWTGETPNNQEPVARDWQYFAGMLGLPVKETRYKMTRRPFATWLTAAVLAVIFLATQAEGLDRFARFAFIPEALHHGPTLGLITSFFLHAGWIHLLSNVYFLLVFGEDVENVLGPAGLIALLATGTVAGNLTTFVAGQGPAAMHVGASGGISAALAFFACQFPHAKLYIRTYRSGVVQVFSLIERFPAAVGFLVYVLAQLIYAFIFKGTNVEIGYFAHLGGAAVGFLAFLVFGKRRRF